MATVFQRIDLHCKRKRIPLPFIGDRKKIGRLVIQKWFDPSNPLMDKFYLHKTKSNEWGWTCEAIEYPNQFNEVIDAVVASWLKPKRKRVPLKK